MVPIGTTQGWVHPIPYFDNVQNTLKQRLYPIFHHTLNFSITNCGPLTHLSQINMDENQKNKLYDF
jgi:hypothetical protein